MLEKSHEIRVAVFSLLFLTSGFLVTNDILPNSITIIMWVLSLLYLCRKKIYINPPTLLTIAILIILMWASYICNNDNLLTATKVTFTIVYATVFVSKYSFDDFSKAYRDVLYYLSYLSIVLFLVYSIIPPLQSLFTVQNRAGRVFSSIVVFVFSGGINRNYGMFWEPGAFQTFVSLALLLEIRKEQKVKKIIIYFIAIVSTLSTTGYFALSLMILLLITDKRKSFNKKMLFFFGACIVLCLGMFFSSFLVSTDSSSVFGKLINFVSKQQYLETYGATNSATVRFYSIIKPLEAFLKSPIVGMCHNNLLQYSYLYTRGMNTCTFVNWFAMYGVFFGTFMFAGYYKLAKKISNSTLSFFVIMLILLIVISTEDYADNSMISLFCYYGIKEIFVKNQSHSRKLGVDYSLKKEKRRCFIV